MASGGLWAMSYLRDWRSVLRTWPDWYPWSLYCACLWCWQGSVCLLLKLQVAGLLDGPVNSYYEDIFETGVDGFCWLSTNCVEISSKTNFKSLLLMWDLLPGVDEMSWDDLAKNDMEWPPLREVRCWRSAGIYFKTPRVADCFGAGIRSMIIGSKSTILFGKSCWTMRMLEPSLFHGYDRTSTNLISLCAP